MDSPPTSETQAAQPKRELRWYTYGLGALLLGVTVATGWQAWRALIANHDAWSSSDSWYHPPRDASRFEQQSSFPDAEIWQVASDRMPAAEERLRDVAGVELSAELAAELTGQPLMPQAGKIFFLVRAVCLNRGTGGFRVTPAESELLVEHGSLGHYAVPMKRQALVVRLSHKPAVIYVSCSMDE